MPTRLNSVNVFFLLYKNFKPWKQPLTYWGYGCIGIWLPLNTTIQEACALGYLFTCIQIWRLQFFLDWLPYIYICNAMQVRSDWESVKIDVMYRALKCKFSIYPHLNSMLLSTAGSVLVEASPHDLFWGGGRDGEGLNYLGRLLMQLRSEFLGESPAASESTCLALWCTEKEMNIMQAKVIPIDHCLISML